MISKNLYCEEAEKAVLGTLLIENQAWDYVCGILHEEDFFIDKHKKIFRVIKSHAVANASFDVVSIYSSMLVQNIPMHSNEEAYIYELADQVPVLSNIKNYIDIVKSHSLRRQLKKAGEMIIEIAQKPEDKSIDELVGESEARIFNICKNNADKEAQHITEGATEFYENTANMALAEIGPTGCKLAGISTGFKHLDKKTRGLRNGNLIVLAARPSMGKTALALDISKSVAENYDKPVLVYSLEMPASSLASRMCGSMANIDQSKIDVGDMSEDEWGLLVNSIDKVKGYNIYIQDDPILTPMRLHTSARRLKRKMGGISLIVIDYLQLMEADERHPNRALEITTISRRLKLIARDLNVPVLVLSQLNRSLESRQEKRPVMSDLRESGAIEQDADLILFIFREEVYKQTMDNKGLAEIIISKQRNGPIGRVMMRFIKHLTTFKDHDEQEKEYP